MNLSIINSIKDEKEKSGFYQTLEKYGDRLASPGRLLWGRTYYVENKKLKTPEVFSPLAKTTAVVLFPLTAIATIFGLLLKKLALLGNPKLADKYTSLPIVMNARIIKDTPQKLPPNPLTPNCVNSQQKSIWGTLFDTKPLSIPQGHSPEKTLSLLEEVLQDLTEDKECNFNASLVEKQGLYRHYEIGVYVEKLQKSFTDDLDISYDPKGFVAIRSASRIGIRDVNPTWKNITNFKLAGANKKRIELIRKQFQKKLNKVG